MYVVGGRIDLVYVVGGRIDLVYVIGVKIGLQVRNGRCDTTEVRRDKSEWTFPSAAEILQKEFPRGSQKIVCNTTFTARR